jgi:hypothetical protein
MKHAKFIPTRETKTQIQVLNKKKKKTENRITKSNQNPIASIESQKKMKKNITNLPSLMLHFEINYVNKVCLG